MQVLKEISDQFNLCATIMSDPRLMREQPALVARQFSAAMLKIELLRAYLIKPVKDGERFDHWMDETIIDAGIRRLVTLVLKRHLAPLLAEKMPKVFEKELNKDLEGENVILREIREVNCAASLVLLYYYLLWHVTLIRLNGETYPCQAETKVPWESDEDFKGFWSALPNGNEILELRTISKAKAKPAAFPQNTLVESLLVDAGNIPHKRVTNLVTVYRSIIHQIKRYPLQDEGGRGPWWVAHHDGGAADLRSATFATCHVTTAEKILSDLTLFGKTISLFNLQDDVQKWDHMYTEFEVRSDDIEKGDLRTLKPKEALYRYRLIDVLTTAPHSKQLHMLHRCAIHDYGSTALMMDISKSLLNLEAIHHTSELEKFVLLFVAQSLFAEHPFLEEINQAPGRNGNQSGQHKSEFIAETLGPFKKAITLEADTFKHVTVDQLAGYYVGSRQHDLVNVNHQYLALPFLDRTNGSFLYKLQHICAIDKKPEIIAISILQPMLRNSLFVTSFSDSAVRLLEKTKCHRLFPGGSYIVPIKQCDERMDMSMLHILRVSKEAVKPDGYINDSESPVPRERKISHKTVLEIIKSERVELQRYTSSLKEFSKFPGFSWPVKFEGGTQNNFSQFTRVRAITKAVPAVGESVYALASRFDEVAEKLPKLMSGAGPAAANAGPIGEAENGVRLAAEAAVAIKADADRAEAAAKNAATSAGEAKAFAETAATSAGAADEAKKAAEAAVDKLPKV